MKEAGTVRKMNRAAAKLAAFLAAMTMCAGLATPVSADSGTAADGEASQLTPAIALKEPDDEAAQVSTGSSSVSENSDDDSSQFITSDPSALTESDDEASQITTGSSSDLTETVGDSAQTSTAPYQGYNIDKQSYDTWSSPVESYLVSLDNGFMAVKAGVVPTGYMPTGNTSYDPGIFIVQYFDNNYQLTETREFDLDLPIWGGFCTDGDYYYILSGQSNPNESDTQEVYRVTKYDTSWNAVGTASLYGANTYQPFDAGSARMVCSNGYLLIRTCHTMYKTSDGYHHQANVMIEVDTASMKVTDSYTDISNISQGYVSHSFNQFIDLDGNQIVAVDHGDAYPRSVVLTKYDTDYTDGKFINNDSGWYDDSGISYVNLLTIPGETGDNYTGVSVGGLEQSDSRYIVAGNSVNLNDSNYENLKTRNIFVSTVAKDLGTEPVTTYITNYAEGDTSASTPQLVKTGSNSFVLLWTTDGVVHYTALDGNGKQTGRIYQMNGALSDCKPIVRGNEIIWYTWKDGYKIYFYSINIDDLSKHLVYHPASMRNAAFADVKNPSYCYDSVSWAVKNDITQGKGANRFDPEGITTRAQAVTFLWRAAGSPDPYTYSNYYDDVSQDAYYFYPVMWASDIGITQGTSATTFSPEAPVTRGQIATFLWRYASQPAPAGSSPFVDVSAGSYCNDAVIWAYENGITSGTDDTHFGPGSTCTRGQIVTFMNRAKTLLDFPQ